jgi:excisionase family DNA binding protein
MDNVERRSTMSRAKPERQTAAAHDSAATEELTTQEAAELLNVDETFLLALLKDGSISSTSTSDGEIRLCASEVLAYKHARSEMRKKLFADMLSLAQETGTYS